MRGGRRRLGGRLGFDERLLPPRTRRRRRHSLGGRVGSTARPPATTQTDRQTVK